MANINKPDGISELVYREIVASCSAAYSKYARVPTMHEILEYSRHRPSTISKVINSSEFKTLMRERGFNWAPSNSQYLSPEQVFAVSIITDPTRRQPMSAKLKSAGITYAQYRAWLKQPKFKEFIHEIGERMLNEHVADVHTRLTERAANGDIQAMRLYYELTGRADTQANRAIQDLQRTTSLLLEVITRYITDPKQLSEITNAISAVTTGEITSSKEAISNFGFENIVAGEVVNIEITEPTEELEFETVENGAPIGEEWSNPHSL